MTAAMTGQLDTATNAPRPQKSTGGAAYVIACDADGVPQSGAVTVELAETRVNNAQIDPVPAILVDDAGDLTGVAANPLKVDVTNASIAVTVAAAMEVTNDAGNPIPGTSYVKASDGAYIDPSAYAQTLSYTGSRLDYVQVTVGATVYRQTFTYTGDNLTGVSVWTVTP